MSDMLFDTSPIRDDDNAKRKHQRRHSTTAEPPEEPAPAPEPAYLTKPLGATSDAVCASCGGSYWEIFDTHRREWFCQCVYCGMREWRAEVPGHLRESPTLREGRFAGLTLDQVAGQEYGVAYIEACAKSHSSAEIQKACQVWLDGQRGAR